MYHLKYELPLQKRKVRDLASALNPENYSALDPVPDTEVKTVRGKLTKNPADDLVFTSKPLILLVS
jgi:hypothetical protein